MKVYIIYDEEGCEILGIHKIFLSKEDAIQYLDTDYHKEYYEYKYSGIASYKSWLSSKVHEFTVESTKTTIE